MNLGPIHTGHGAPHNTRTQIMEHTIANGSVHTGCKKHQRVCMHICTQICLRVLYEQGLGLTSPKRQGMGTPQIGIYQAGKLSGIVHAYFQTFRQAAEYFCLFASNREDFQTVQDCFFALPWGECLKNFVHIVQGLGKQSGWNCAGVSAPPFIGREHGRKSLGHHRQEKPLGIVDWQRTRHERWVLVKTHLDKLTFWVFRLKKKKKSCHDGKKVKKPVLLQACFEHKQGTCPVERKPGWRGNCQKLIFIHSSN